MAENIIKRARSAILRAADRIRWLPPLLARITLFAIFTPTGWGKLHDLPKVTKYFVELGIPWPHLNAVIVGATEFGCGILLLVGLFSRYATMPIIVDMAVAIATAKWSNVGGITDFFGLEEFVYIVLLVWVLIAGPGLLSIDGLVGRKLKSTPPRIIEPATA